MMDDAGSNAAARLYN